MDVSAGRSVVELTAENDQLKAKLVESENLLNQFQSKTQAQEAKGFADSARGIGQHLTNLRRQVLQTVTAVPRLIGGFGLAAASLYGAARGAHALWRKLVDMGIEVDKVGLRISDPLIKNLQKFKDIQGKAAEGAKIKFINTEGLEKDAKRLEELTKLLEGVDQDMVERQKDALERFKTTGQLTSGVDISVAATRTLEKNVKLIQERKAILERQATAQQAAKEESAAQDAEKKAKETADKTEKNEKTLSDIIARSLDERAKIEKEYQDNLETIKGAEGSDPAKVQAATDAAKLIREKAIDELRKKEEEAAERREQEEAQRLDEQNQLVMDALRNMSDMDRQAEENHRRQMDRYTEQRKMLRDLQDEQRVLVQISQSLSSGSQLLILPEILRAGSR